MNSLNKIKSLIDSGVITGDQDFVLRGRQFESSSFDQKASTMGDIDKLYDENLDKIKNHLSKASESKVQAITLIAEKIGVDYDQIFNAFAK